MDEMRDVDFDDIDAFINEMHASSSDIEDGVVRCDVTKEEINSGKSKVFVVAGFCVGEQRIQLQYDCGESLLGCDNTEASASVANVVLEIDRACVGDGLDFRRGVFQ